MISDQVFPYPGNITLIIVPVLYLFSERELASNRVVWVTLPQLYKHMCNPRHRLNSVLDVDAIDQTLFYFPFRGEGRETVAVHARYKQYLCQQGLKPLYDVKAEDDLHEWLRRIPDVETRIVSPRISHEMLGIPSQPHVMRACEVFELSLPDFLLLPMTAPAKMATALSLRLNGVSIDEVAHACGLSRSQAQAAILLGDMKRADSDFCQKLEYL